MTLFKFNPGLTDKYDLEEASVGRNNLVRDRIGRIKNALRNKSTFQMLFLGPRGIGKSHMLQQVFHSLSDSNKSTPIWLGEEYSISNMDGFCQQILKLLNVPCHEKNTTLYCRSMLSELMADGKPVVLFVENLQVLFEQMRQDLGKLRSIIQSDQSLCIVGSNPTYFDAVTAPDEPFYRFFDTTYLQGLTEEQTLELIKKRLALSEKKSLVKPLEANAKSISGLYLLTKGNPRLVHILADAIIQKNSADDLEENIPVLLDQLTPFYLSRMNAMSFEQRRIFDAIALAEGPLSPTEVARRLGISKPAIVVAQLRRLEKDGLVENVKFSNKKGTKYQITERLYRIWRELRSAHGLDNVMLLIHLIKSWYGRTGKTPLKCHGKPSNRMNGTLKPHSSGSDALAEKINNLTDLKRQNSAVKAAKQLFAQNIEYFVQAAMPYIEFRLEAELLAATRQYKKSLLKLEPDRLSMLLSRYIWIISHGLLHAIIDKNMSDRQFFTSVLHSIKDMADARCLMSGYINCVVSHAKEINSLQHMTGIFCEIFSAYTLRGLTPLMYSLDYITSKDPDMLERLHPESRELAVHIIQKMSPDHVIDRVVLDSIHA